MIIGFTKQYYTFPYKSLDLLSKTIHYFPIRGSRIASVNFLYPSFSKSLRYDLWLFWAISFTIPYQNHWNMTYDCCEPFPVQLLIKSIEIWHLTTRDNFLYISLSKSLKSNIWLSWAISCTIRYQMLHKRTRWDY